MPTKVVNIMHGETYDIFVGRPSIWGNPYIIGKDGTRKEVIEKYEIWVRKNKYLMGKLKSLKGKRLGCYCAPLACHGDVLARLADA